MLLYTELFCIDLTLYTQVVYTEGKEEGKQGERQGKGRRKESRKKKQAHWNAFKQTTKLHLKGTAEKNLAQGTSKCLDNMPSGYRQKKKKELQ